MQDDSAAAIDHGEIAFFIGNLCQEADLIYRFGYALTLSELGAERLLMETYRSVLGQLHRMLESDSHTIRMELMKAAWVAFSSWKDKFDTTDSLVLDLFQSLKPDVRVPFAVVDGLGFTPDEAGQILHLSEDRVRHSLLQGRKKMISFDL